MDEIRVGQRWKPHTDDLEVVVVEVADGLVSYDYGKPNLPPMKRSEETFRRFFRALAEDFHDDHSNCALCGAYIARAWSTYCHNCRP